MSDSAADIAVRLIEARDAARRIYGARYREAVRPFVEAIKRWKAGSGRSTAEVCKTLLELVDRNRGSEGDMLCAMAASCEMLTGGFDSVPGASKTGGKE